MIVGTTEVEDPDAMRTEILTLLEEHIARYELPQYIEFCEPEGLPRSTSGKIVRRDIENWILDESTRVHNP